MWIGLTVLAVLTSIPLAQSTQAPPPTDRRGYLQPAVLVIAQPQGGATNHRVTGTLDGWMAGASIAAGRFLSSTVALEAEVATTTALAGPQHFSYNWTLDYVARSRDLLFNGIMRVRPHRRVEFFAGGGYAQTRAGRVDQVRRDRFIVPSQHALPDESFVFHAFTMTAGLDAIVPLTPHIAAAPTFRFRWVPRPDYQTLGFNLTGPYSLQMGLGFRFR